MSNKIGVKIIIYERSFILVHSNTMNIMRKQYRNIWIEYENKEYEMSTASTVYN